MPDVVFRHGDAEHIDYTPGAGNINAGTVVILGNTTGLTCAVADFDLVNNVKASLSIGGYWRGSNLNNATANTKVYWDYTNKKFTTVNTFPLFGFVAEEGGGGANSNVTVKHFPYV